MSRPRRGGVTYKASEPRFLTAYSTDKYLLLAPNTYQCGVVAIVFSLGTPAQQLGIDLKSFVYRAGQDANMRFTQLNALLNKCEGGGKAILLQKTNYTHLDVFMLSWVCSWCPTLLARAPF